MSRRSADKPPTTVRAIDIPVAIEGLEGDLEVISSAEQNLLGFEHRITYRSKIRGGRVNFKFDSSLTAAEHKYELPKGSRDSVGELGKRWIHSGETKTNSTAPSEGLALITTDYIGGGSEIRYVASGEAPFSMPYEGTVPVPFT